VPFRYWLPCNPYSGFQRRFRGVSLSFPALAS